MPQFLRIMTLKMSARLTRDLPGPTFLCIHRNNYYTVRTVIRSSVPDV